MLGSAFGARSSRAVAIIFLSGIVWSPVHAESEARCAPCVLASVVEAAGGADAILEVGSVRYQGRFDVFDEVGDPTTGTFETLIRFPDRMRQQRTFDQGESVTRVLNGDRGHLVSSAGVVALEEDMVTDLRKYLGQRYLSLLRALAAGDATDVALVEPGVAGVTMVSLRVGESRHRMGIDTESSRIVRIDDTPPAVGLEEAQDYSRRFSEYRVVGGVAIPTVVESWIDGRRFSQRSQDAIELDPAATPGELDPPTR